MISDQFDWDQSLLNGARASVPHVAGTKLVAFKWVSEQDKVKTKETGVASFKRVLRATIWNPGSTDNVFHDVKLRSLEPLQVDPSDKLMQDPHLRPALLRFVENASLPPEGTPLETWPLMTVDMVDTLKSRRIFTIEHLALLAGNDSALRELAIPNARELAAQAKARLEVAKDEAAAAKLAAENQAMREEMDVLRRQLSELKTALDQVVPETTRRKGKQ